MSGHTQTNASDAFQQLQSTHTKTRRARPPVMDFPSERSEFRVPLKPEKLNRRQSKGGLRGIFSRTKSVKKPTLTVSEEVPASPDSEFPMRVEKLASRSDSIERIPTVLNSMPATPVIAKPTPKASRMNLRTHSVTHNKAVPKSSLTATPKASPKAPNRTSAAWDPPPLLQAYPQAIKHATLAASTLSADSIIRISNHKREDGDQSQSSGNAQEQAAVTKKAERAKSKHRRQVSGSISKADWTQKIFVLVTSGYLLQYAGEGSFDRLPEKMMQLGKDSVAFASDVIPGKHWVLQISQSMDADGTPAADSRSLFSRLTFRTTDYRRTATSLLLVLQSAEDMDSWIAVVRREIEGLGGKKSVTETGKPRERVVQSRGVDRRSLIQRDPDQFSNPTSPTSPTFTPSAWVKDAEMQEKLDAAASTLAKPRSMMRPTTGHQSIANSVVSHDGLQLQNLRDSSNRLSYMSSGQRTLITSHSSSPATSPMRESHPSPEEVSQEVYEDARPRPNAAAINERRRSMQAMHVPRLEAAPPPKNFRHSTFGSVPARPHQNHSPPNLTSTLQRFSSSRVLLHDKLAVPTIVKTTPTSSKPQDPRAMRKGPPVALSLTRPLSPVEDTDSAKRQPLVFTPTDSSFEMVKQVRPSVVDIPPRPPTAPSALDLPIRRSSLKPLSSNETPHFQFQFLKRFSGGQVRSEEIEMPNKEPVAAAPPPPAATSLSPGREKVDMLAMLEAGPEGERLSPLPALANTKQKLRRPISMQIQPSTATSLPNSSPSMRFHPSSHPPVSSMPNLDENHQTPKRPTSRASIVPQGSSDFVTSTRPTSRARPSSRSSVANQPPSLQRLKVQPHPKAVGSGKSMQALTDGPPPAPPPSCALPPLPSPGMPSVSLRHSVLKV